MKLKKWLKYLDPVGIDVIIWVSDKEKPVFKGSPFDIPKKFMKRKIGRIDNSKEEPIFIYSYTNEHNVNLSRITINII